MSTDTPNPERVTLTETEEAWGGAHWQLFREHRPTGAYPQVGQMAGDCRACGGWWPCGPVREALAERDAAREQALREEIEKVEAERDALINLLRANSRAAELVYPYCLRCGQETSR